MKRRSFLGALLAGAVLAKAKPEALIAPDGSCHIIRNAAGQTGDLGPFGASGFYDVGWHRTANVLEITNGDGSVLSYLDHDLKWIGLPGEDAHK